MQKRHNYTSLSFSSRLRAYIQKVEADYERTRYYKKHWHLVELIENLEIFTVLRFSQIAAECGIKTSRRSCSTFFFYLHLDNFLEFTPVHTLMGRVAHLYSLDTIDPERKAKAIAYYESINPTKPTKHDPKKDGLLESYITSYDHSQAQSAGYRQARTNRAIASETAAKEHIEPKLKEVRDYKAKLGPAGTKAAAARKKKEKAKKSKK